MTVQELKKAWPVLKRQVMSLNIPWLESMTRNLNPRKNPFKVLISCILSLRTQDKTTGSASERLFSLAPDVWKMSELSIRDIERAIYPVGFYRVKARRIKEICTKIIKDYNGHVPDTMDALLSLKGVGRKTANLVLTLGHNKDGICVDTHVHRITNRWGFVNTKTPYKTEMVLRQKLPHRYWHEINGILVAFGQGVCKPISPHCTMCRISNYCKKIGVTKHR